MKFEVAIPRSQSHSAATVELPTQSSGNIKLDYIQFTRSLRIEAAPSCRSPVEAARDNGNTRQVASIARRTRTSERFISRKQGEAKLQLVFRVCRFPFTCLLLGDTQARASSPSSADQRAHSAEMNENRRSAPNGNAIEPSAPFSRASLLFGRRKQANNRDKSQQQESIANRNSSLVGRRESRISLLMSWIEESRLDSELAAR